MSNLDRGTAINLKALPRAEMGLKTPNPFSVDQARPGEPFRPESRLTDWQGDAGGARGKAVYR